jgi:hypothetical protein
MPARTSAVEQTPPQHNTDPGAFSIGSHGTAFKRQERFQVIGLFVDHSSIVDSRERDGGPVPGHHAESEDIRLYQRGLHKTIAQYTSSRKRVGTSSRVSRVCR